MTNIRHWLLPLLLGCAQVAMWPGLPLLRGAAVQPLPGVAAVAAAAVVTVALCWRRSAPVVVTAIVVTAVTPGMLLVPDDNLAVLAFADLIALYSVAVHRPGRQVGYLAVALTGWQGALTLVTDGLSPEVPLIILLTGVVYLLAVALGRARRRFHADRAAAARRLAEAEERRRGSADAERHRLARELHDVTAHHLTSIVVTASAAQRLAGRRPELAAEALDFAARTGRETLAALHRLVAVMRTPDERPAAPAEHLEELADGFRRLGQVVSVDATPERPSPAVAQAVHGIAREALTNTLRYAPGSAVRVRLTTTGETAELVVEDDGIPGATRSGATRSGTAGLGSGRGLHGMRERAAAVGGVLDAGRGPEGGWRVRASLPWQAGQRPVAARRRLNAAHGTDAGVALLALLLPAGSLLIAAEEDDLPSAAALLLIAVVSAAQILPLLLRRRYPWPVLATALLPALSWPILVGAGLLAQNTAWYALTGLGAVFAAVYAVAAHGGSPALTWLAPAAATGLTGTLCGIVAILDGGLEPKPQGDEVYIAVVFMMTVFGAVTLVPMALTWTAGVAVRHRRVGLIAREGGALAIATAQAVESARAERARVATGLREDVLHRTAQVSTAADRGDLDAVLESARAALAAMRGLLSGLHEAPGGERAPQPGVAAIGALCERARRSGRDVAYEATGAAPSLPADADVSAYRMVELVLNAGTGPASVGLGFAADGLRLTVTGMPADPDGALAAGLRARATAAGGTITIDPAGSLDIRLPAASRTTDLGVIASRSG